MGVKDMRTRTSGSCRTDTDCPRPICPLAVEAFVSVVGMGDDINGMIRTCPPPRDGESELACQARIPGSDLGSAMLKLAGLSCLRPQVDSSILVTWVGNIAAKLSLACSNCALSTNIDAVCSAGAAFHDVWPVSHLCQERPMHPSSVQSRCRR